LGRSSQTQGEYPEIRADQAVAGIVLAGGRSRRMGQDKALLRVGGGPPLISLVVDRLRALVGEVIVVTSDGARLGALPARIVPDVYADAGPLSGIYSGLLATDRERALVTACDMPFLSSRLLAYLLQVSGSHDVVLPRLVSGFLEPLHAVYSQTCREVFRRQLDAGRYSAIGYLDQVKVRYVEEAELRRFDPELRSFFNVNTQADLERALDMGLGGGTGDIP
jgi:molybdenum cofactor guanylyltransferase